MSTTQHEAAAGAEQAEAAKHARRYDPAVLICTGGGSSAGYEGLGICWTSTDNPTSQHLADAAHHREFAQQHRAAAQSLRDAEATACAGIAESDRDTSPFYHREDIASVQKVETTVQRGEAQTTQLAGAKAVFRAVPGLTELKLQHLVDCHMARSAALGHNVPGMEYCPLTLKDVTAVVTSVSDGFAIEVTSSEHGVLREVLRRMRAAVSRHGSTPSSTPNSKEGS